MTNILYKSTNKTQMTKTKSNYEYKSVEQKMTPKGCITRKVIIYKNGKGYKSITTQCSPKNNTRKNKTVKRPLSDTEITDIQQKRFIRGLFDDCKNK
jgi:hypothetical protein